jgi:opacity protein-like surface antigen
MRKVIGSALTAAAVSILLADCAQSPAPVQPLPPGPTADEVANYARAQGQYRAGLASGNGDVVMHATNTFSLIASEILSGQDPPDGGGRRSTFEPQFVQDCRRIDGRYNQETVAIRRHLEAKIAAADRATVAEAGR